MINSALRRVVPVIGILALSAVAVVACGNSSAGTNSSSGPIKIGFVDTETGPEAIYAESHIVGARFAAEQANKAGGVLGRKVDVIEEDDQWTASLGVAGMRKLATQGVHFMIAGSDTDVCNAEIPLLQQLDMVMLTAGCSTDSQTGPGVNPNFFRVNSTTGALSTAAATFICSHFPGVKRIDALTYDYVTTVDVQADLNATMGKLCGATKGTQTLVTDVTGAVLPYMSSLMAKLPSNSSKTAVLSLNTIGPNVVNFLKQGLSLGFYKKYITTFTTLSAFNSIAAASSPDVPVVYQTADYAYDAFKDQANVEFVKAWEAAHAGTPPNSQELDGYREMNAILDAMRKANSTDVSAVKAALAGLTFADPTGTLTINARTHQAAIPIAIVEYDGSSVHGVTVIPADKTGD